MKPTPILFLSDSPYLHTGLSRITKDLAVHVSSLPQFRVGCLGRGGIGTSKLPFATYSFDEMNGGWGEGHIEAAWDDFAGNERGIIMTVFDLSRLDWFTRPRMGGRLQEFLESGRIQKWGYIPIDHYGVGGKLTSICADTLLGYDRILAYTIFGKQVLEDTLGKPVDWIPHGINGDAFAPRPQTAGRLMLGVRPDDKLIGCVMTNQARKDWGTAFAAMAILKTHDRKFWVHTDVPIRHWNMYALAKDFGLEQGVIFTFGGEYSSEQLSYLYSACNVTMLPSLGEGLGYPIIESLACGVPVVHTNYAGGVELIPERDWLVDSPVTRLDGQWNCVRPVLDPRKWAEKIEWVLNQYGDGSYKDYCVNSIQHLLWRNLWASCWSKFFLDGLSQ